MTTISNADLPGYDPSDFRSFMSVIQRDWNLPQEFIAQADFYFLRHWSADQIRDNIGADGITVEGVSFFPLFKRDSAFVYSKELNSYTGKMFWLSFRAVRYPLGAKSGPSYGLKCYVLIQEDTRSVRK